MIQIAPDLVCAVLVVLSLLGLLALKLKAQNAEDPIWLLENRDQIKIWANSLLTTAFIFTLGAIFL